MVIRPADQVTANIGLVKPDKTSPMNDFTSYMNNNWDTITAVPAPPIITGALPQSGAYNIGDRVFRTDDTSIYILIAKDANWGWFWRPVHAAIAPWLTVPSTAINLPATWTINPDVNNPFAITLDNRGNCYWRGAVGIITGTIAPNNSYSVLKPVPAGMLPRQSAMYCLGYTAVGASSANTEGARIFIPEGDGLPNTIRVQGNFTTTCQMTKLYFDGNVQYAVGTARYTGI